MAYGCYELELQGLDGTTFTSKVKANLWDSAPGFPQVLFAGSRFFHRFGQTTIYREQTGHTPHPCSWSECRPSYEG